MIRSSTGEAEDERRDQAGDRRGSTILIQICSGSRRDQRE